MDKVKEILTAEEFKLLLTNLNPSQKLRLTKYARYYCPGTGLTSEDLLQEAICKTLDENGRTCPRNVNIIAFLKNAMRSIASNARKKYSRSILCSDIQEVDNSDDCNTDVVSSIEVQAEKMQSNLDLWEKLESIFKDDPQVIAILIGIAEELSPQEICDIEPMTKVEYATARRRMRRAFDKEFIKELNLTR